MKNQKIILLMFMFSSIYSYSQDTLKRTIGLTTFLQGQDFGIQIPIWLSSSITVAPSIQFQSVQKQGTDIIVGIVPKFYLNMHHKLKPYFGLKIGAAIFSPPSTTLNEKATTDMIAGMAFGGEYFFDPRFSIGVEAQLNYTKSDINSSRFGNPGGTNLNTASVISVNIYFGK